MRVYVYVDGFNLYYRALRGSRHKWLDLRALATNLLNPSDKIVAIRYACASFYVAISGSVDGTQRSSCPQAPRLVAAATICDVS